MTCLNTWKLRLGISKLRSNDQIAPDSKTMALKSGFSEIDFGKNLGFMDWMKSNKHKIKHELS